MPSAETQYLTVARSILTNGTDKPNRTGVPTRGLFGQTIHVNLANGGFPLLTTKRMPWGSIVGELLGFIRGVDSAADFRQLGSKVWDQNANEEKGWLANPFRTGEDDLGRIYGVQWRRWKDYQIVSTVEQERYLLERGYRRAVAGVDDLYYKEIDQLADLIHKLRNFPNDRRMIVSAWNPGDLTCQALPPCHMIFQCHTSGRYLNMEMTQRSADWFLGVPFNIASYALLLKLISEVTGYYAGELKLNFTDAHIYHNHFDQVREQLCRIAKPEPVVILRSRQELWDFTKDDIVLEGYESHPTIRGEMAV